MCAELIRVNTAARILHNNDDSNDVMKTVLIKQEYPKTAVEERKAAGVTEAKTWGEVIGHDNKTEKPPKVPYSQNCVKQHTLVS